MARTWKHWRRAPWSGVSTAAKSFSQLGRGISETTGCKYGGAIPCGVVRAKCGSAPPTFCSVSSVANTTHQHGAASCVHAESENQRAPNSPPLDIARDNCIGVGESRDSHTQDSHVAYGVNPIATSSNDR
jgi:hypothetical protein